MGQIQISSPILRSLTHSETSVSTSSTQVLAPLTTAAKRVIVLVQNKSTSVNISLVGNSTDVIGIIIPPLSNVSIDNYNGGLWAFADSGTVTVHVATSVV
jgi:hypothetical protein